MYKGMDTGNPVSGSWVLFFLIISKIHLKCQYHWMVLSH